MFGSSSRTTRTYHYSGGGGPGGTKVTETRTVDGPDGKRTETRTFGGGASSDLGDMSSGFGDMSLGFGGMRGSSGGESAGGQKAPRTYITSTRSRPTQSSRYIKGWGQRKERQLAPMQLEGKTYSEIKAQCKAEGRLFEDPDFPAVDSSIFYSRAPPRPFIWKRPHVSIDANGYSYIIYTCTCIMTPSPYSTCIPHTRAHPSIATISCVQL